MDTSNTNDGVVVPDPEHDYHGHPNYEKVFLSLLVLFGLSLIVGYFVSPMIAIVLIFLAAIWKTALVVKNFMHLSYEPMIVWILVLSVLFILVAFFFGVHIDVTAVTREVVPR